MEKATKRQKLFEARFISVGVEEREKTYRDKPPEKGVMHTCRKVYSPPLPYNHKEKELSEDLNDGI